MTLHGRGAETLQVVTGRFLHLRGQRHVYRLDSRNLARGGAVGGVGVGHGRLVDKTVRREIYVELGISL